MVIDQAGENVESLVERKTLKEIIEILKTNNRVCGAFGSLYSYQLQTGLPKLPRAQIADIPTAMPAVAAVMGAAKKILATEKVCCDSVHKKLMLSFMKSSVDANPTGAKY